MKRDANYSDLLDTDPVLHVKIKIGSSQNQAMFSSFSCPDLKSR